MDRFDNVGQEDEQNFLGRHCSSGWNPTAETLLREWAQRSQQLKKMHVFAANFYTSYFRCLTLPFLISGALASIGTGGTVFENMMWLRVLSFFMTLITTILGSITNFLDYGRLSEKHHQTANGYSSFARKIITSMMIPASARPPLANFVKDLRRKYEEINDRAPLLPNNAIETVGPVSKKTRNERNTFSIEASALEPSIRRAPKEEEERREAVVAVRRNSEPDVRTDSRRPFQRISRSVQLSGVAPGARIELPPVAFFSQDGNFGPATLPAPED